MITTFDKTAHTFTQIFKANIPQMVNVQYRFDTNYKTGTVIMVTDFDMLIFRFSDIFKQISQATTSTTYTVG